MSGDWDWKDIIQGVRKGAARIDCAKLVNESLLKQGQSTQCAKLLFKDLNYFSVAKEVLAEFLQNPEEKVDKYGMLLMAYVIETCAKILLLEKAAGASRQAKDLSQFVSYALVTKEAVNLHFTCCSYLWAYTWKLEVNGKFVCTGPYKVVEKLTELLSNSQHLQIRLQAAGALWGICGNRGTNAHAQNILHKKGTINTVWEKLLKLTNSLYTIGGDQSLSSNERKQKINEKEKEGFVLLSLLTAATTLTSNPTNSPSTLICKSLVDKYNATRSLVVILHHAIEWHKTSGQRITSDRIAKCLDLLGNIMLVNQKARDVFIKNNGVKFLEHTISSEKGSSDDVRNSALLTLTYTCMEDLKCKEVFGNMDIIRTLVKNVINKPKDNAPQHNVLPIKYNSALALSALTFKPSNAPNKYNKICKAIQDMIFETGGLETLEEFLQPIAQYKANKRFYSLPISTGLRMATDVVRENKAVQLKMLAKRFECTICHKVLEEDYGQQVVLMALEFLCAMAWNNRKVQEKFLTHNIGHFIMSRLMERNEPSLEVQLACARTLWAISSSSPETRKQLLAQMARYKKCQRLLAKLHNAVVQNMQRKRSSSKK